MGLGLSVVLGLAGACGGGSSSDTGASGATIAGTETTAGSTAGSAGTGAADSSGSSGGSPGTGSSTGQGSGAPATSGSGTGDSGGTAGSTGSGAGLDPPAGQSSGGSGGGSANGDTRMTSSGVTYRIIAPGDAGPLPLMVVYSGTEGGATMTQNLMGVAPSAGLGGTVFAVLDGTTYYGDGQAGADVLDEVRAQYDIDNDRTYLLSESAGTSAGLELGLSLRQSYFAAYWANDVNASAAPAQDAGALGFAPFGNAGPGGDLPDADAIVSAMMAAGYRTPAPAPYDGAGSGTHGDPQQFIAALQWFPGKTRQ